MNLDGCRPAIGDVEISREVRTGGVDNPRDVESPRRDDFENEDIGVQRVSDGGGRLGTENADSGTSTGNVVRGKSRTRKITQLIQPSASLLELLCASSDGSEQGP